HTTTATDAMPDDAPQLTALRELRDEIKRVIDYRSFYLRYCPNANQSGARLQTLCPIPTHRHSGQGHPSLSIDLTRGLFHCFSRDEGGDAIKFYELMHGATYSQAVCALARDLGLDNKRSTRTLAQRAAPDPMAESQPEPEPLPRARSAASSAACLHHRRRYRTALAQHARRRAFALQRGRIE